MAIATLKIRTGETGKVFEFTLTEDDGTTPIDITSATVKMFVERNETKTCAIINGPAGRADYEAITGDYPTPGVYTGAIEMSGLPAGVVSWTENFEFIVEGTPEPAI